MSIYKERPTGICCVYLLIFPDWKLYVGYATGDPRKRWKDGTNYRHNPELQQAIKDARGWENVKKILLIENVPLWLALDYERHFVKVFDTMYPRGYNMNSGGGKGFVWCQKTKDKIRASTNPPTRPVDQIDPETGAVLATWPSMSEASRATGSNDTAIWRAAHGQPNKAAVYDWKLVE